MLTISAHYSLTTILGMASEGAAVWYAKQLVVARAVHSTFGIIIWRPFDATNPVHRQRSHKAYLDDEYVAQFPCAGAYSDLSIAVPPRSQAFSRLG
jgi:hypothetical protein